MDDARGSSTFLMALFLISKGSVERFVVFDPVGHGDSDKLLLVQPDDHAGNAGIDDLPFAHGAAGGIFHIFARLGVLSHQV